MQKNIRKLLKSVSRITNLRLIRMLLLVVLCTLATNWLTARAGTPAKLLKVGFIVTGPVNDSGWNCAHNEGCRFLGNAMKDRVQTMLAENVPESAEVERVMEKMIAQGAKLLFCTSYGYLEPALRVAKRHPDVIFMQCQRSSSAKNIGHYFAKQFEPLYVAGFVAGRMTKTNKIGYVGGHPVPTVLSALNALTLGARAANPKVIVQVVWINSWFDPASEVEATKGLIESGADVITSTNSTTVVPAAERQHVFTVGCNGDFKKLAPKGCLTSQLWNWGPLYAKIAESVLNSSWKSTNNLYSMKDGYVDLASFGDVVPDKVRKEANSLKEKIKRGQLIVFQGPMKDRDGKVRIPAGKIADNKMLETMDWLVAGVYGSLPKK